MTQTKDFGFVLSHTYIHRYIHQTLIYSTEKNLLAIATIMTSATMKPHLRRQFVLHVAHPNIAMLTIINTVAKMCKAKTASTSEVRRDTEKIM